ncbi:MAG: DNA polymerase/3'-5' exonuclease PolX [Mucilaginibacter polytrichastri]|nr:DNA polymerase/3'-5' exonuclease PolX [Mucilaginibacter polytrichastri]
MDNKSISRALRLLSQLMELHGENPFKVKSMANAAFKIDKLPFPAASKSLEELEKVDGIGKSTAAKIRELADTGTLKDTADLLDATPPGVVEMLGIKGIGPKKIATIWHDLHIESIGELYYACNENRLVEAKGFGLKTQQEIIRLIEFRMGNAGQFLYAQVEQMAASIKTELQKLLADFAVKVVETGPLRRQAEVLSRLDYLVASHDPVQLADKIVLHNVALVEKTRTQWIGETESGVPVHIEISGAEDCHVRWFETTGSESHVEKILAMGVVMRDAKSEDEIYQRAGLSFIQPELREDEGEIEYAKNNPEKKLIEYGDLRGTLHNHSTWSDGVNTLEEMALYCRDDMKLDYLGICDHSKTAVYAKGLSIERVLQQHDEIDALNAKLDGFRIFKGIESDVLGDGSLDYPEEVLEKFDFVVASVHSNLKMDEQKATGRVIKAIENPYTTILGHPTGRLLLSRAGYPLDFRKVIDACAANGVVIEINANPLRLDLDWRWHRYALEKGVMLSINPDAHRLEGFHDMRYGTIAARKGGVQAKDCLNTFSLEEISAWFAKKRAARSAEN